MTELENFPTLIFVAAAAIQRSDGLWLMHRRPDEKLHGGQWEFPGGKLEKGESPAAALVREIQEELGIGILQRDLSPVAFAESPGEPDGPAIVILLYKVTDWTGEPAALEGGAIAWFDPEEIALLDKPPLDWELAARLFGKIVG